MEKSEITEILKVAENQVYEMQVDLKSIESKLRSAYKYEDELVQRQIAAKQKTEALRNEFFGKANQINEKFGEMKNSLDIWTGNFYRNINAPTA